MADTKEVNPELRANTPPPTKDSKDVYGGADPVSTSSTQDPAPMYPEDEETFHREKRPWWSGFFIMGHVLQIIVAALLAIALGLGISAATDVPDSARTIIGIPGMLWLRCLQAIVIPLIVCAMILAVQRLRAMEGSGGKLLARWTVGFYVLTTIFSIIMSVIMTSQIWAKQFTTVGAEALAIDEDADFPDPEERPWYSVVETLFQSFIPANIVKALAENELLSILITAIVIGYLIRDANSTLLKLVAEIENMVTRVVAFIIKLAPFGVFFLILPNLFRLNITEIGENLGYLIGGTLATMSIQVLVVLPALFFGFTRKNPYSYWIKISPAWITAWGCASSAATLPVTLRMARERGIPRTVYKFTLPLGCLINMDGTAIYFPMAVVFMAATQGITLSAVDYVLMVLLSTLSAIGTTPIPSSSLVLTLMIATSIGVPQTGMYAVIVAIDWFLDRFRTAINVSGDLFGTAIITKMTGITDDDVREENLNPAIRGHDAV